jgi:feruloyl esterase
MNFQVQNSFYHAWVATMKHDAAGKPVLLAAKLHCCTLPSLHNAMRSTE